MSDIDQIPPHGGTLVNLLVTGAEAEGLRAEAANLPKLAVSDRELADLEMLAVGALSPLTGFQGEADYHSILDSMHLTDGLPWSIPVTLSVDDDGAHRLGGAAAVALTAGEGGEPLAVLRVSEIYSRRQGRRRRSRSIGRTTRSTPGSPPSTPPATSASPASSRSWRFRPTTTSCSTA